MSRIDVYETERGIAVQFGERGPFYEVHSDGTLVAALAVPAKDPVWTGGLDPNVSADDFTAGYEAGHADAIQEVESTLLSVSYGERDIEHARQEYERKRARKADPKRGAA